MPQPPQCPHCPTHPQVWKDMTTATVHPDDWRWHCSTCTRVWRPNPQQKLEFA